MKRLAAVLLFVLASLGPACAQEVRRFELSVEKGTTNNISGPEIQNLSDGSARFGWAPSENVQLTLTYTKWTGELAKDDTLADVFAREVNGSRPDDSKFNFKDAVLDKRDMDIQQLEFGITKSIPLSKKHWEAFIGIQVGGQKSHADVDWVDYEAPANDPTAKPAFEDNKTEFMLSVRGGVRFAFIQDLGLHVNVRWIPIGKIFEQNYNAVGV